MTHRTWQDNAEEYGALEQGRGWPYARLIACSVERGAAGRPAGNRMMSSDSAKVSASEFARRAGIQNHQRIVRYLDTWNKAAADGLCPPADELSPDDAHRISDPDALWSDYYDSTEVKRNAPTLTPSPEPTHAWTILVEARKLMRDMEALATACDGVKFDGEVQDALRELVSRIRNGADLLGMVIESEPMSDAALHTWIAEGTA